MNISNLQNRLRIVIFKTTLVPQPQENRLRLIFRAFLTSMKNSISSFFNMDSCEADNLEEGRKLRVPDRPFAEHLHFALIRPSSCSRYQNI
jgi:hypothetical protein